MGNFDDHHLREFIAARGRGDAAAMRRHWDELVIAFNDRMDGFVALAHCGRLDADEHEEAVQRAMVRFAQNLIHTYDGVSMGQLVNASMQLAEYICMDVQRAAMRHPTTSADAGWEHAGEDPDPHGWEVARARKVFDDATRAGEIRAFLEWALPQLPDQRREVVELTFFSRLSDREIAERLGTSPNNVQQLRSRGLRDLAKLYKEQWDA